MKGSRLWAAEGWSVAGCGRRGRHCWRRALLAPTGEEESQARWERGEEDGGWFVMVCCCGEEKKSKASGGGSWFCVDEREMGQCFFLGCWRRWGRLREKRKSKTGVREGW